jgi:RNA polymerase sigma-70 factor (ECF subfamily)
MSEADLVARLRSGDDVAFETLVRDYGPRMLAVARRYLPEPDAEDALQDAMISVFRGISKFEGESRLTTWLHRVVVNAALMRIRSRSRRPETALEEVQGDSKGPARPRLPWTVSATEILQRSELREEVRRCVDRLPETLRIAVRLRDIEGWDMETICQGLGIGLSTLKARLHRGRQTLREALDPRLGSR